MQAQFYPACRASSRPKPKSRLRTRPQRRVQAARVGEVPARRRHRQHSRHPRSSSGQACRATAPADIPARPRPQIRTQRRDHRLLMLVATRIRVETVPDQIIAHVTGHARNLHRCDMHIRMDDAHRRLPCDENMAVPLNRVTHACSFRSSQRIAFRHLHYERSPGIWSSRTVNLAVACGRCRIRAPARTMTVRVSTGCAHGSGGSSPCRSSRPARRRPAGTTCHRWLRR